jgi:serine/threonine-protein kinase
MIATGGMSAVYRGLDLQLDSQWPEDHGFPVCRRQPVSDGSSVGTGSRGLKDPGLVAVYDQGIDSQHRFW